MSCLISLNGLSVAIRESRISHFFTSLRAKRGVLSVSVTVPSLTFALMSESDEPAKGLLMPMA